MRQVFTSQRHENVEGVAELLRAEGIEVRITHGRSYKGNRRGAFKYTVQSSGPQPAVWVVKSEDQPRARALLRVAGLLESTRPTEAFLAPGRASEATGPAKPDAQRRAMRIKLGLLAAIAIVIVLQLSR